MALSPSQMPLFSSWMNQRPLVDKTKRKETCPHSLESAVVTSLLAQHITWSGECIATEGRTILKVKASDWAEVCLDSRSPLFVVTDSRATVEEVSDILC